MADRLDELEQEVVASLLKSWVGVYRKGQEVYDSFPTDVRALVDEHGYEVDELIFVVARMKPHVRDVCRALVEDAYTATLSQDVATVNAAVERTIAQAKSGGTVDDETYEERIARLEGWCMDLDERLGRIVTTLEGISATAQAVARTQER